MEEFKTIVAYLYNTGLSAVWTGNFWVGGGYNGTHHIWLQSGIEVDQTMLGEWGNLYAVTFFRWAVMYNTNSSDGYLIAKHVMEYGWAICEECP